MSVPLVCSVRDARDGDIEAMTWARSAGQRQEWLGQLARAGRGEVDFLVAELDDLRSPVAGSLVAGSPVAGKAVLDWVHRPGDVAWLQMVSVQPEQRGRGLGSALLAEAERRARARGAVALEMSVEDANPRARGLYERRGYVVTGPWVDEHDETDADGRVRRVSEPGVLLRKSLRRWSAGEQIAVRNLDRAGRVLAVLPMTVVQDAGDRVVAWMASATPIMYWSMPDGSDPRSVAVERRFDAPFRSRPNIWRGGGVLRVLLLDDTYSVLHFWSPAGSFSHWYVNLESRKSRWWGGLDLRDHALDLVIAADGTPTWKDEDESLVAIRMGALDAGEVGDARATGERILDALETWPEAMIGDWRDFTPDPLWPVPALDPRWLEGLAT